MDLRVFCYEQGRVSTTVSLPSSLPLPLPASAPAPRDRRRARNVGTAAATVVPVWSNPLLPAGQDPQVAMIDGTYYYCESRADGIFIRAAADFRDVGRQPAHCVWAPAQQGPASQNLWAPELELIDGRCHIYFAADDGHNANHRMWVLVAEGRNPFGPYTLHGPLATDGWAIDGTTFADETGQRYFVWSGWPGEVDGQQNLYLAKMASPTQLEGPRVRLAQPDQRWERRGLPLLEGPQVLQRGGRTFIVYSASGSWTEHYCLGLLVFRGGDLMDPAAWEKAGRVFSKNRHGWGVGHCGFTVAPDGTDWMLYHSKTLRTDGWDDREVRAQPFMWDARGWPIFGEPRPTGLMAPGRPLSRRLAA